MSNTTRPSESNTTLTLIVAIVVVLVLIIVVIVVALLVIVCLKTHKQRHISSKVHQLQNVNTVLDPKIREDEKIEESYMDSQYEVIDKPPQNGANSATVMDALYSNPDEAITNETYSHLRDTQKENVTPQKIADVCYNYSQLNYSQIDPVGQKSGSSAAQQEPIDVGMLYAVPDKKKKASNKAPSVPDKSSELVEYLDFKKEGTNNVSSGIDLSECNQTDQRSGPSPAQQEPIDVDMLYAIPDKKKKVSK